VPYPRGSRSFNNPRSWSSEFPEPSLTDENGDGRENRCERAWIGQMRERPGRRCRGGPAGRSDRALPSVGIPRCLGQTSSRTSSVAPSKGGSAGFINWNACNFGAEPAGGVSASPESRGGVRRLARAHERWSMCFFLHDALAARKGLWGGAALQSLECLESDSEGGESDVRPKRRRDARPADCRAR
jgi:hypothetical protein